MTVIKDHTSGLLEEMDRRSREVFRALLHAYLSNGQPVSSNDIVHNLGRQCSSATVRNVMARLQDMGLLYARHASSGRLPTERGLQLFVNGLLEMNILQPDERQRIEESLDQDGPDVKDVFDRASRVLSDLANCTCLVAAPSENVAVRHIEFVPIDAEQTMVVLIRSNGLVENRLMHTPPGLTPMALVEAGNYLNDRLAGCSLADVSSSILEELAQNRANLDECATRVAHQGLVSWGGRDKDYLIVHGQDRLVQTIEAKQDIEEITMLLRRIESGKISLDLLQLTENAQGVQIFIGSKTAIAGQTGCSVIAAPLGSKNNVVGAIGVIGPARTDYARIIPMIDFTAGLIDRVLSSTID